MIEIVGHRFEKDELLFQVEYPDFIEDQTLVELLDEHGKDTVEKAVAQYFKSIVDPVLNPVPDPVL